MKLNEFDPCLCHKCGKWMNFGDLKYEEKYHGDGPSDYTIECVVSECGCISESDFSSYDVVAFFDEVNELVDLVNIYRRRDVK